MRWQSRPRSKGWRGMKCQLGMLDSTARAPAAAAALLAAIGGCCYLPHRTEILVKCLPAAVIDRRRPALWSCCACRSSACPAAWRIHCSISWRARWAAQLLLLSCFRPLFGRNVRRCPLARGCGACSRPIVGLSCPHVLLLCPPFKLLLCPLVKFAAALLTIPTGGGAGGSGRAAAVGQRAQRVRSVRSAARL